MRLLSIYGVYLKILLLQQIQYRAELCIWLLSRLIEPIIYLLIWTTLAQVRGGSIDGFTRGDFAAYYIAEMFVTSLTYTAIMWEYEYRVRNGALSAMLLRPCHPIHSDLAETLVNKLILTVVIIPTTFVLVVLFPPTFHGTFWVYVACVPSLVLAFGLRFVMEWTLAMGAFWFTRVTALNLLYAALLLFLSGAFTPLALLPAPIQIVANLLPFRWVVSFPVELALGHLTWPQIWQGLGAQAIWLCVMIAVLAWIWKYAAQKYTAVGA